MVALISVLKRIFTIAIENPSVIEGLVAEIEKVVSDVEAAIAKLKS